MYEWLLFQGISAYNNELSPGTCLSSKALTGMAKGSSEVVYLILLLLWSAEDLGGRGVGGVQHIHMCFTALSP